jgi:hypothetical protein
MELECRTEAAKRVAIELPLEPESARRARAAIAPLRPHADVSSFDDVPLLVSELVSDALAMESPPRNAAISLRAEVVEGTTEVVVRFDGLPLRIRARKPKLGEPGWGVYLVQLLASRWGARHDGESTAVWFEA